MLRRLDGGSLVPADDETAERIRKLPKGTMLHGKFVKVRNPKFLRKAFALVNIAFDMWTERFEPQMYKGVPVLPNKERFRKDLTILAGYYDATYNIRGELRLEAKSWSMDNMEEEEFEALYSAMIDAILRSILPNAGLSERSLRAAVDEILNFA